MTFDPHQHWQKIYTEKDSTQVSWYQPIPRESLNWIGKLNLGKEAKILDVGGGDSRLVDHLLAEGFQHLSVLDISAQALGHSKKRMGNDASKIEWIQSNILDYSPAHKLDLWHDRAAFHFLKEPTEINAYAEIAASGIKSKSYLLLATFSDSGPLKCSGLEIQRYNEQDLAARFSAYFKMIEHQRLLHETPSGAKQEFLFALFQRS